MDYIFKPKSAADLETAARAMSECKYGDYVYVNLAGVEAVNAGFLSAVFVNRKHVALMNVPQRVKVQLEILGVDKYVRIVDPYRQLFRVA